MPSDVRAAAAPDAGRLANRIRVRTVKLAGPGQSVHRQSVAVSIGLLPKENDSTDVGIETTINIESSLYFGKFAFQRDPDIHHSAPSAASFRRSCCYTAIVFGNYKNAKYFGKIESFVLD
jgi:hypothetical protein